MRAFMRLRNSRPVFLPKENIALIPFPAISVAEVAIGTAGFGVMLAFYYALFARGDVPYVIGSIAFVAAAGWFGLHNASHRSPPIAINRLGLSGRADSGDVN